MRNLALVLLAAATIASPAFGREPDGPAPPANYDQVARDWLGKNLMDPYSAVITLSRPATWATFEDPLGQPVNGWTACYSVNAKNAYGGYVGARTYVFSFEEGQLRFSREVDPRDRFWSERALKECARPAPASASTGAKISL